MVIATFLDELTFEKVENSIPTQTFRFGKRLVGCGDVAGCVVENLSNTLMCVCGYVHSEKSAAKWYCVTVGFNLNTEAVMLPKCVCDTRPNGQNYKRFCKHVAALLLALITIRDFGKDKIPPKIFYQANMKRFHFASPELQEQVEYFLSWPEIVAQIHAPEPPKKRLYSSTNNKFINVYEKKSKKRKIQKNDLTTFIVINGLPVFGNKNILIQRLQENQ